MLRHDRWLQRALWLRVPPHLPAWWLPPTPQATPTHRRAPPKQLGGSLRPQQSASAHSKGGECPPQALRGRGDVPHARVARQVARLAPPRPCPAGAGIRVPSALRIAVGGARRARGRRRRRRRAAGRRRATSGGGAADGGHAVRRGAAGAGDAAGHDAPARRPVEDAVCPVWGPPPSASLDYPQARAAPAQLRGSRRPEELASAVAQRCVAFNFSISGTSCASSSRTCASGPTPSTAPLCSASCGTRCGVEKTAPPCPGQPTLSTSGVRSLGPPVASLDAWKIDF